MTNANLTTTNYKCVRNKYGDWIVLHYAIERALEMYVEADPCEMTNQDYLNMSNDAKIFYNVKEDEEYKMQLQLAIDYFNSNDNEWLQKRCEVCLSLVKHNLKGLMYMMTRRLSLQELWVRHFCECYTNYN